MALIGQPSLRPSQFKQDEANSIIEDVLDQQQLSSLVAIEDQTDEDKIFQLTPLRLSMSLEMGNRLEDRRSLDDQRLERLFRRSFETVHESRQFDDLSALGLKHPSQLSSDDSVLQTARNAVEKDVKVLKSDLSPDDESESLRRAMHQDYDRCESSISGMQQAKDSDSGVQSSFTLDFLNLLSRHSSVDPTHQDEQRTTGLSEEPVQTVLHMEPPIPFPSFPAGVIKKIASTFIIIRKQVDNTRQGDP